MKQDQRLFMIPAFIAIMQYMFFKYNSLMLLHGLLYILVYKKQRYKFFLKLTIFFEKNLFFLLFHRNNTVTSAGISPSLKGTLP